MKNVTEFYDKTTTGWSDEWFNEKNQDAVLEKFDAWAEGTTQKANEATTIV